MLRRIIVHSLLLAALPRTLDSIASANLAQDLLWARLLTIVKGGRDDTSGIPACHAHWLRCDRSRIAATPPEAQYTSEDGHET